MFTYFSRTLYNASKVGENTPHH